MAAPNLQRMADLQNCELELRDILTTTILLCTILFIAIPILVIGLGLSAIHTVVFAGIAYGLFIVITAQLYSGLISAFFVLSIFKAGKTPLLDGPLITGLNVYIIDIISPLLLLVVIYDIYISRRRVEIHRSALVAIVAASFFIVWVFLSIAFGGGVSKVAAMYFSIERARFFLLFVTSILIIQRTNLYYGAIPFLTSIYFNIVYSTLEFINGPSFGSELSILGTTPGRIYGYPPLELGPFSITHGSWVAGFVGTSRSLVGLSIILMPFLLFYLFYSKAVIEKILSMLGICSMVILMISGAYVSGIVSMILVLITFILLHYGSFWQIPHRIIFIAGTNILIIFLLGFILMSPTLSEMEYQLHLLLPAAIMPRLEQYAVVLGITKSYPLFGLGGHNFYIMSNKYINTSIWDGLGIHNVFLSHLVTLGIPGATFFLTMYLSSLNISILHTGSSMHSNRIMMGCFLSGLVGIGAYFFANSIHSLDMGMAGFWVFTGMIIGSQVNHTKIDS